MDSSRGPDASGEPEQGSAAAVNGPEVLEKLAELPISTWNYRGQDPSIRHMGPMAQDFFAAFGLGGDDRWIHVLDANGVVMVAVQALHRRVKQLEAELAELKASGGRLER